MIRHSVTSRRIASVGWENDTLEVEFHNGAVYQYYNVSRSEYQSFMSANSLGSELSRLDKIHRYRRII
ncbi:KTSC domain-containing protein [Blautia obeum]|uniref:KTSC domain-containing protein n=1 Tax=Blautia obeum TaxID=40520 RepID=UPI002A7DB601|nr:KTSC domain-containing protein [Lachnospiraceae bacterium]MDY2614131.1 KTSC domain-containing protein [Lachnospiraceae bacterium]MDY4206503.1 KTSC domain-containing protein [Lachnospiraceae bacterium]